MPISIRTFGDKGILDMLNKEVCKKCHKDGGCWGQWLNLDNDRWDEGFVYCETADGNILYEIKKEPPEECKYKLEHLVIK